MDKSKTDQSPEEWKNRAVEISGSKSYKDWKVKCPSCGHVQGAADFEEAGVPAEEAKNLFYQECVGRKGGTVKENNPGPCNYAAYGFLQFGDTVLLGDGNKMSVFPLYESN